MPHPFMTPRGHMANLVACSKRAESLEVGGVCPLMMQTLQLLPVRYGVVEDLDPSVELAMPYTLQSRPLGFRLRGAATLERRREDPETAKAGAEHFHALHRSAAV